MKKIVTMAFAAILMVGCSSDKQIGHKGQNPANAIGFRTVTLKNTRATETDITNIRDFKVFGLWDNGSGTSNYDFMHNVTVTRDLNTDVNNDSHTSTWTYAPIRYWPAEGTVSFYAYSPAGSRGVTVIPEKTTATTEISYTVPTAAKLQEDFLVAKAKDLSKPSTGGEVELKFEHALSQLVFEARSGLEDVIFHISEIKITDMDSEGIFDLANYSVSGNTGWTVNGTPKDYIAPLSTSLVNYDYQTNAGNYKYIRLSGPNDGLMVLPQTLNSKTLVITYSAQLSSGAFIAENQPIVLNLENKITGNEFKMGKKYVFQLTLTDDLTPITFTVDVEGWVNAVDTPIETQP